MIFDLKTIDEKNKIIDNAILQLKKDFVGIDEQIDQVMNNVRTWYLYPELQSRPVIVSLWGMSGIGKTSLVRKIAKYLNIEKDLVYFNFAEIGEMHSYEIESTIEEELSNERSNRMFVYDEFQYAATLDSNGEEKDNKSGLKPFWELMDSGILHKRHNLWETKVLTNLLTFILKINTNCPIELNDGAWVNAEECLHEFKRYDIQLFERFFNFNIEKADKTKKLSKKTSKNETIGCPSMPFDIYGESERFFIKQDILESILKLKRKTTFEPLDMIDEYHEFCGKSIDEIISFLKEIYEAISKGYDLTFNDSLIFVIGNLDEAYSVSFNVDPDMSPDQFHKITKKISIVDIKEALQKRFRNEQIARLGNIHVIYPAFSSQTFKDLIEMSLNEYAQAVREKIGYDIRFDNLIKKCIYDEAVYPTHGTRPIFSTIHEIVKSKLPLIIQQIQENNLMDSVEYIEYSFKKKNTIINIFDKKQKIVKVLTFKNKLYLNNLRKSSKDEQQALCAVHESGHFVVYLALNNKLPDKLVSKTTSSNTGGFLLEDIDNNKNFNTLNDIINEIQVCLGGYIAEKLVFGEKYLTNGACTDLEKATILASKAIREWGFSNHPYIKSYLLSIPNKPYLSGYVIKDNDEEVQEAIKTLFNSAYEKAEKILKQKEWRQLLKESSQYLATNSYMPKKKMQELYNKIPNDVRVCQNDRYYRDKIDSF